MNLSQLGSKLIQLEEKLENQRREILYLRAGRRAHTGVKLFALGGSHEYGESVARELKDELQPVEEISRADGENFVRSLVNIRRSHVVIIQSGFEDKDESVNDKIIKLLLFIGACVDASAEEITVFAPYFPYARLDRKVKSREPVGTKILARAIETIGCNRLMTFDAHNLSAEQNAFRTCYFDNLQCNNLFADHFAQKFAGVNPRHIAVGVLDAGGLSRGRMFRKALSHRLGEGIGICIMDKEHDGDNIKGDQLLGNIRPIIIGIDDMIASGSTVREFCNVCQKISDGIIKEVHIAATHGLFVGKANENLNHPFLTKLVIADTIAPFRLSTDLLERTEFVSTTKMAAEAIRRTSTGESLSSLFA